MFRARNSVRLSVCLSHAGIVSERPIKFLWTERRYEIPTASPIAAALNTGEEDCDFQQNMSMYFYAIEVSIYGQPTSIR